MSFDHLFEGSEAWEKALLIDDDISESSRECVVSYRAVLHFEVVDII